MGYRELLKHYIRYLELHAGDNYIESIPGSPDTPLSDRDVGELRAIAAEIFREANVAPAGSPTPNYNARFRLLLNHADISIPVAAEIAGVDEDQIRRWRSQPRSRRYRPMNATDFERFEAALGAWLEARRGVHGRNDPERRAPAGENQPEASAVSRRGAAASRSS